MIDQISIICECVHIINNESQVWVGINIINNVRVVWIGLNIVNNWLKSQV